MIRITSFLTTLTLAAGIPSFAASDPNAVLWESPGQITLRDWIWGPGGEARAPKPPFEFIQEDSNGTNAKLRVRDAKGDQWTVKFAGEEHGDVFGSRLLNAVGYMAAPTYFVASGIISGAHDLRRAKPFIGKDGGFSYARFKLRDHKTFVRAEGQTWSWNNNPFAGTEELNGLKILLMLTSNWDGKDARDGEGSNTAVYSKPGSASNRRYYAFDDWGATMGKWGGFFKRDKWNPDGYRQQTKDFAKGTPGQAIEWGYRGKHGNDITWGVTVRDVRWLLTSLSKVTDEQLRAGLRASGATEPQIDIYARSIRDRIGQLQRLAGGPAGLSTAATASAPWSRLASAFSLPGLPVSHAGGFRTQQH